MCDKDLINRMFSKEETRLKKKIVLLHVNSLSSNRYQIWIDEVASTTTTTTTWAVGFFFVFCFQRWKVSWISSKQTMGVKSINVFALCVPRGARDKVRGACTCKKIFHRNKKFSIDTWIWTSGNNCWDEWYNSRIE